MNIINKSRTIRPSTRKETFKSYRVDTNNVDCGDKLILMIYYENIPDVPIAVFEYLGKDINGSKTIHFNVLGNSSPIKIVFGRVKPNSCKILNGNLTIA